MNTPTIETLRNHTNITDAGYALLSELLKGSPDVLVIDAPVVASRELLDGGLLRHTADRYEVSAQAWKVLRAAEEDEAYAAIVAEEKSQEVVRVRGLTTGQTKWCYNALCEAGYDTEHDPTKTLKWGRTWLEGTREDLEQVRTSLDQMVYLIDTDPTCEYAFSSWNEVPEAVANRLREQVKDCCEAAALTIFIALDEK